MAKYFEKKKMQINFTLRNSIGYFRKVISVFLCILYTYQLDFEHIDQEMDWKKGTLIEI